MWKGSVVSECVHVCGSARECVAGLGCEDGCVGKG